MHGLAITDVGVEDSVVFELKEHKLKGIKDKSIVKFRASEKEMAAFASSTQSSKRVLLYLGDYYHNNFECVCDDSRKILKKVDFKPWFKKNTSFKVECERIGEHTFTSQDVEEELGAIIVEQVQKKLNFKAKVSMKNPDLVFFCYIYNNNSYLGIDLAGKDLSKREYKVYNTANSIRGNIAYALLRMADYSAEKVLLDPFAGSSVIPIEAALSARKNFTIHAVDGTLRHLKYGKNNAKIAGVEEINFSKANVEWLDTKFEKESVDCIVTHPPQISKRVKNVDKIYDELFYQAGFILKKKGCIVALMVNTEKFLELAKKHKFKVKERRKIVTGGLEYVAVKLGKV